MEKNNKKRLIISLVYLFFLILIIWWVYSIFKPVETCSDGVKNQNEEDTDCGGVCNACKKLQAQPLIIQESGVVESGISGSYDFYAYISNPNNILGSPDFSYEVALKDASGNEILKKTGNSFILPGEKKYIVENNLKSENIPASAEFKIGNTQWMEFVDYYERPQLDIVNKNYSEVTGGVGFSEAKGLLKNKSSFDFDLIKVRVVLKNSAGKVIALNSTEMKTVKSGDEREFKALWPNRFSGEVANMEAQAEVNIFKSETFLKRYYRQQNFGR